jgi:hypothetical protein
MKDIFIEIEKSINEQKPTNYISDFWKSFQNKIRDSTTKKEKQQFIIQYTQKETFLSLIHGYLDRSLMGFLGMVEEDEDEDEDEDEEENLLIVS